MWTHWQPSTLFETCFCIDAFQMSAPRNGTAALFDIEAAGRSESADAAMEDPAPGVQTFKNPPPVGFQQSARNPQGSGRLLVSSDVSQSLPGRHAELYWPPEHLWYLVEIQSVNVEERNAIIMYYSGETEELDLDDIISTKHMRLLS